MVVVAGFGGDSRPVRVIFGARRAHDPAKARDLGERLGARADGLTKKATEMPLAHTQIDGDRAHAGAGESVGGVEDEPCPFPATGGESEAFRDRAFQNGRRLERVASVRELIEETLRRRVAPEVFERDDAAGDRRGWHAQHRLRRTQAETRHHDPLLAAKQLATHPLQPAQRVDVETALRRRPEADREMHLGTWNHDASRVAVELTHGQRRDRRGVGSARPDHGDTGNDARVHEAIVRVPVRPGKPQRAYVRFFQCARAADPYMLRMKILVTGATGKVGSRLAKRLAQRGHYVRALVRDLTRATDLGTAIEVTRGDLLVPTSLAGAVRDIDAVVHCAAFFRGATAEQAHAVNDLGTQHLAKAARDARVARFVFTSTGLVYGPRSGNLAREGDACTPIDSYPKSKLAAEGFLLDLEGLDVRVLRLPFVYGDGDAHIAEAVPMMRGFPPSQRMSISHHADVARAVASVLEAVSPAHRIYNVTDDEAPDLATLFASVGDPPPDGSNAERARAFDAVMDGTRLRAELGFEPQFPRLADAIAAGQV